MSVLSVTMWRATCNTCSEGLDGDYWAWADAGQALDEWRDWDNVALADGRLYHGHRGCLPAEVCWLGDAPTYAHTYEDGASTCAECDQPRPTPAKPDSWRPGIGGNLDDVRDAVGSVDA